MKLLRSTHIKRRHRSPEIIRTKDEETETVARAVYEHPLLVRLCHWINAIALFVMVGSGLQIFRAFPSFGAKIPQKDLVNWPKAFAIGGWLGGALQWHLTFVDLHRHRPDLSRLPTFQRKLPAGLVHAPRFALGVVADGQALLLLRAEAAAA